MRKSNVVKVSLVALPMLLSSAAFAVETDHGASTLDQTVVALFAAGVTQDVGGGAPMVPPSDA